MIINGGSGKGSSLVISSHFVFDEQYPMNTHKNSVIVTMNLDFGFWLVPRNVTFHTVNMVFFGKWLQSEC